MAFNNLVVFELLNSNHHMHNLHTKFVKILKIYKQFTNKFVNEKEYISHRYPVPNFSDLEVVALFPAAETESIDSENRLFEPVGGINTAVKFISRNDYLYIVTKAYHKVKRLILVNDMIYITLQTIRS